jgi:DNA-binding transcriptional MerR regulator
MNDNDAIYPTKFALRISGLTPRQLDMWTWSGLIRPHQRIDRGGRKIRSYTFRDLVAIRTMAELRRSGITPRELQRISDMLAAMERDFADTYLLASASDVLMVSGDALMSVLRAPGQLAYNIVFDLGTTAATVRAELLAA